MKAKGFINGIRRVTFVRLFQVVVHNQLGRPSCDIHIILVMFGLEEVVLGIVLDDERDQRDGILRAIKITFNIRTLTSRLAHRHFPGKADQPTYNYVRENIP